MNQLLDGWDRWTVGLALGAAAFLGLFMAAVEHGPAVWRKVRRWRPQRKVRQLSRRFTAGIKRRIGRLQTRSGDELNTISYPVTAAAVAVLAWPLGFHWLSYLMLAILVVMLSVLVAQNAGRH